jgi:RNA polymerase sigma-70 factor (ECF subfamily)
VDIDPQEPTDDMSRVADRDQLDRAFLQLSVEHRSVMVLVHYVGLTAPEVAAILGVPAGTVYSRLHYAARQLRDLLSSSTPLAGPERAR